MLWHCQGLSASFPLSGWMRRGSSLLVCEGWHPLSQSLKQAKGVATMFILAPFISPCALGGYSRTRFSHAVAVWMQKAVVVPNNLHMFAHKFCYTHFHMTGSNFLDCRLGNFYFFFGKRLSCRLFGIHCHGWQYLRWNFYIYFVSLKINSKTLYCP